VKPQGFTNSSDVEGGKGEKEKGEKRKGSYLMSAKILARAL